MIQEDEYYGMDGDPLECDKPTIDEMLKLFQGLSDAGLGSHDFEVVKCRCDHNFDDSVEYLDLKHFIVEPQALILKAKRKIE